MNTPTNTYWTTRDNRKLLIADMDIDHVHHCVNMLIRKYGHDGVDAGKCCWRQRLTDLVVECTIQFTLAEITNPNQ